MAKKGGQQQLQAEINTDEEFEKFLERPGLLVLDVYSEWCGPCLGMVGSLKKIKLELGGDNLQLAICKSDTISYLKRFNKKSEPTWMFVSNGKAVNLMFGTDVPKLMKLIANELKLLNAKDRRRYEITELHPEEVQRRNVKLNAEDEAIRIELAEKTKKRRDYLTYVTDMIMENLPDIGVTMFGPQVNRDMFKKVMEPADLLKIQCKDRKVLPVLKENFDVINFACKNPLDEDVIGQLHEKELLMCFWKIPEDSRSVPDTLIKYATDLTKTHTEPADEFNEEERVIPAIISPLDVKFEVELEDGEECVPEEEPDIRKSRLTLSNVIEHVPEEEDDEELEDEEEEEDEGEGEGGGKEPELDIELDMPEMGLEDGLSLNDLSEVELEVIVEPPPKRTCMRKVTIPPIWVPNNHRTHAALIYVFFRSQTTPFLPPDPVPEPPHVIMAFDAYKRNDLIGLADRHKDDVPLYGFFTSDDADEATFITNSAVKYKTQPHTAGDKIVFKVNKQTSHTMLSLATYGPSYVSPNTVIGHEETLKFFGENYMTAEQELLEQLKEEDKDTRKSKRGTKMGDTHHKRKTHAPVREAVQEEKGESTGEGATSSGEESGDSMPPEGAEGAEGTEGIEGAALAEDEAPAEAAEQEAQPATETEAPTAENETPPPEVAPAAAPAEEAPAAEPS